MKEAEDLITMLRLLEEHEVPAQRRMVQYLVSKVGLPVANGVERHVANRRGRPVSNTLFSPVGGAIGGSSSASDKNRQLNEQASEVLEFLNVKAGKSFQPVDENLRFIRARLAEHSV